MSKIVLYPADGYDFDAADVAAYLAGLTSGVFSSAEDFPVTAADGLKVTVGAGRGWVHPSRFTGYSITKREADTLTLPLADPSLPRIDRIVMRYDAGARAASLQVLQGTASSTPTAPAISRTELIYDLCLAEITRPAGSTAVTTGQITDTRLDEKLCGIVRDGVTGIPTDELLAAARERINALEEKATTSAAAAETSAAAAKSSETKSAASEKNAKTSETAAQQALQDTKTEHTAALQDIARVRTTALNDVANSTRTATAAAETATQQATAAAGSASTASTKAGEASTNRQAAEKAQKGAEKAQKAAEDAAELAGTRAGTDKTLSIPDAPADAKATGDALEKKADKTHTHDLSALINTLSTGSSTPQDADYYVSQYVGGGDTTTIYHRRPMSALWAYIKGKADVVFAAKSHTHNYAGSGSAGGSANSAVKLDTATAGSATKPVYISGGKPVACTHSLGKDVPANAVFTDHTYAKMTAATASRAGKEGLVPAPAAGAQGKFLRGDGTWQAVATSGLSAYPVGSIYQSTNSTSPAALFGGTWEQIASERVLMGASSSHKAGTTVNAGLPNITGTANGGVLSMVTPSSDGAFGGKYYDTSSRHGGGDRGDWFSTYNRTFDASKSNPIYGASNTVQPAAYYVYIWHRVS